MHGFICKSIDFSTEYGSVKMPGWKYIVAHVCWYLHFGSLDFLYSFTPLITL